MYEELVSQLVKGKLTPDLADVTRKNRQILKNTNLSQEPCVAAHAALTEDAYLESLITNIFTQMEANDMADYMKGLHVHDGRADAECARRPSLQLGRVCQLSARHAAIDGSVRQP